MSATRGAHPLLLLTERRTRPLSAAPNFRTAMRHGPAVHGRRREGVRPDSRACPRGHSPWRSPPFQGAASVRDRCGARDNRGISRPWKLCRNSRQRPEIKRILTHVQFVTRPAAVTPDPTGTTKHARSFVALTVHFVPGKFHADTPGPSVDCADNHVGSAPASSRIATLRTRYGARRVQS